MKKIMMALCLIGALCAFKYYNFFAESLENSA